MNYIEIMNSRSSVRSFSKDAIEPELKTKISNIISKKRLGPFGSVHQFKLIDTTDKNIEELGRMSSYGLIRGASLYFAGYCDPDDNSVMDYGYCFHEALIELTAIKLGTCWLGGTFNRSFTAKSLSLPEGKIIPATSPVGRSLEKKYLTDRLARSFAGSDKRKQPESLFFSFSEEAGTISLDTSRIGKQQQLVLSSVRTAPSASNKQPWRLVVIDNKIHLYWDFDKKYNQSIKDFNIQALDMGIAMYHIKCAASEISLSGDFSFTDPSLGGIKWRYVASFG